MVKGIAYNATLALSQLFDDIDAYLRKQGVAATPFDGIARASAHGLCERAGGGSESAGRPRGPWWIS
jgi:hypothetical protein